MNFTRTSHSLAVVENPPVGCSGIPSTKMVNSITTFLMANFLVRQSHLIHLDKSHGGFKPLLSQHMKPSLSRKLEKKEADPQSSLRMGFDNGILKMDSLQWKLLLKRMIWGYPHCRTPPHFLKVIFQMLDC